MTYPDATLNYWADRFVGANAQRAVSFEQFMQLPHALRERRLQQAIEARHLQECLERELPNAGLHGGTLIDPIRHDPSEVRRPWFHRVRHK